MTKPRPTFLALMLVLCTSAFTVSAQTTPLEISKKIPYYINANSADKSSPFEIQEGLLHVQYEDKLGAAKDINLDVYNWKYENVGKFRMDKSFGLNHYTIDLQARLSTMELNQNYFVTLTDENGGRYEWMIKNIPPVRSKDMQTDIVINPIRVNCDQPIGNRAEFYSKIMNGVAPYTIRWYVMDPNLKNFIYQPREEVLEMKSSMSVVQVERAPGYYVILDVTDACGTNSRKMVFLSCEQATKKANSIFFQPLEKNVRKVFTGIR